MKTPHTSKEVAYLRSDIIGYRALETLALDLSWTWSHCADKVWRQLDRDLWDLTHNPWVVLQTVSCERLVNALADTSFRQTVEELVATNKREQTTPAWFQHHYPNSQLSCIAYFSMEYMLSEALPIYSGGLGNVAGDQLKSASDLGVPVVGVGLLYQQGYFRQTINKEGNQQAVYPYNDPGQLPITPLRKPNGEWLRVEVPMPGWPLWLRAWQVQVGRVNLYLLDSNDAANYPPHRGITSELYGGDSELRIKQELLLGIGGWRLLEQLGIKPEVCHLNEGHAAFLVLDRARSFMEETGQPFDVALEATRVGNLFTTHTAVAAGFDRFAPSLIAQFLGKFATNKLKISLEDLLALGRLNPMDPNEPFNMAYLAIRGSGAVNAVSRLHCTVSRKLFEPLFKRWPESEIPVGYVTNGVHMPTWDSAAADALWTTTCGKNRWLGTTETLQANIDHVSDEELWKMRNDARKTLVDYTRSRLARFWAARGLSDQEVDYAKRIFDPNVLTLGFARRFATYKRPNMLLQDPDRLLRILTNLDRPVQLLMAGKAHPADQPGKELIHQWIQFMQRPEARNHVVFLTDYDMQLTQQLVQGVDVWINTPRRPWEACGTSGMKVLVNGGLNLSELDGWWAEAYSPEVGWAIGDRREHGSDPEWDRADALALYDLLENEVVPSFYNRDASGQPKKWLEKIRTSMARLTPQYSANRSVREYTESYYLPAAKAFRERTAHEGEQAKQIIAWKKSIQGHWNSLHFGELQVHANGDKQLFEVEVNLNGLDPQAVQVELYADGVDGSTPVRLPMLPTGDATTGNAQIYKVTAPQGRPSNEFTPRIIPKFEGVSVPLETTEVFWRE